MSEITTSAVGAALDYLAAAATTAYAAYAAANNLAIQVIDGPPPAASEEAISSLVWIGYDPTNPDEPAALGTQDFVHLNTLTRDEQLTIVNTIEYWTGDVANVSGARQGAFALLAVFELLLRGIGGNPGDTTLGGAVTWSQITSTQYTQDSASPGLIARIVFRVSAKARLTIPTS